MQGEGITNVNSSVLKFGLDDITPPTVDVIPGSIFVGAITGVLGAIFVSVNSNLSILRKKMITKNWQKLAEAAFFSFITTSMFYWLPYIFDECRGPILAANSDIAVSYTCPEG